MNFIKREKPSEPKEWWLNHLDNLWRFASSAQEEYISWLEAFEDEFGEEAREQWENAHV